MRIKKENAKLQNLVLERDILINRLSSELKATNIYTPPEKRKLEVDMHNKETTETPYYNCSENEKGLSCNSTDSESYVTSIAEHLQKHKQQYNLINNLFSVIVIRIFLDHVTKSFLSISL